MDIELQWILLEWIDNELIILQVSINIGQLEHYKAIPEAHMFIRQHYFFWTDPDINIGSYNI